MTEPPDVKPVRPWHWPRIWWHDQAFWREVATRSIAGLIVVILAYIGAVSFGYISGPGRVASILVVTWILGLLFWVMVFHIIRAGIQSVVSSRAIVHWTRAYTIAAAIIMDSMTVFVLGYLLITRGTIFI